MISFNALLASSGYDLAQVRLLRHKDPAATPGRSIYELWRDDRESFEFYQSQQRESAHQRLRQARHWAAFVGTPQGQTMFAGMYEAEYLGLNQIEIVSPTTNERRPVLTEHMYHVVVDSKLADYTGRLFIDWGKAAKAWIQRGDASAKPIIELRRKFIEDAFPGYLAFATDLSRLSLMPDGWKAALTAVRGVYVLTCPRTKELYIGSATGLDGFLGRWNEYVRDGHGGNIQLKSRDRSDYQVAILEVAGTSMTTQDIQNLESLWKSKLETRKMGLNSN